MSVFVIDAEKQVIATVDISRLGNSIRYAIIESDALGDNGERVFFDEECSLRDSAERFQIDRRPPVKCRALLTGTV